MECEKTEQFLPQIKCNNNLYFLFDKYVKCIFIIYVFGHKTRQIFWPENIFFILFLYFFLLSSFLTCNCFSLVKFEEYKKYMIKKRSYDYHISFLITKFYPNENVRLIIFIHFLHIFVPNEVIFEVVCLMN